MQSVAIEEKGSYFYNIKLEVYTFWSFPHWYYWIVSQVTQDVSVINSGRNFTNDTFLIFIVL